MSRLQIDAMIKADPIDVVIRRYSVVKLPDGGTRKNPTPTVLVSQKARLIPFKRRMTEFLNNTELGDVPDLPYVLLGYWDMDLKRGDLFTYNGDEFEVKTLDIAEPEVKTSAHVDYYGGENNG